VAYTPWMQGMYCMPLDFLWNFFFRRKYAMTTQVRFKFLHKECASGVFHRSSDARRYCIFGTETRPWLYWMVQGACAGHVCCMHANLKLHSGTLASKFIIVRWVALSLYLAWIVLPVTVDRNTTSRPLLNYDSTVAISLCPRFWAQWTLLRAALR
jgi:hypothetical protein